VNRNYCLALPTAGIFSSSGAGVKIADQRLSDRHRRGG
jgi:hypothetical protein